MDFITRYIPSILSMFLLLFGLPSHNTSLQRNTPQNVSTPIYYGAYVEQSNPKDTDLSLLSKFESDAGKGVAINQWFEWFGGSGAYTQFSPTWMDMIRSHGSIPMITWEPMDIDSPNDPAYTISNIVNGTYDPYVIQFADAAKAWGHPFFLRFAHEMNGNWYPWSEQVNGNHPGQYVLLWKHVHDIFTKEGVTNATWVWCPSGPTDYATMKELYPGDNYVDWTCLDGYNYGGTTWKSFSQIFQTTYASLLQITQKPIMIAETASTEKGGSKPQWITDMLSSEIPTSFPQIKALLWFNSTNKGKSDWFIESSPQSQAAFSAGIQKSLYANNQFANLTTSPIQPLSSGGNPTPTVTFPPTMTPFPSPVSQVSDTFHRPNQVFWGIASDNHKWGGDANNQALFAIVNNTGQILHGNARYNALLGPSELDSIVTMQGSLNRFSPSTTAGMNDQTNHAGNLGAVIRSVDDNNFYKAHINGEDFTLSKRVNNALTILAHMPFHALANKSYTIKIEALGNTLSAKVWQTGYTEPINWMIKVTDTSFIRGKDGINANLINDNSATFTSFIENTL